MTESLCRRLQPKGPPGCRSRSRIRVRLIELHEMTDGAPSDCSTDERDDPMALCPAMVIVINVLE